MLIKWVCFICRAVPHTVFESMPKWLLGKMWDSLKRKFVVMNFFFSLLFLFSDFQVLFLAKLLAWFQFLLDFKFSCYYLFWYLFIICIMNICLRYLVRSLKFIFFGLFSFRWQEPRVGTKALITSEWMVQRVHRIERNGRQCSMMRRTWSLFSVAVFHFAFF